MPIVASDIHGYKQVVQRGVQGLLVEPKNYRALAALYALSNDAEPRIVGEAAARAPEYSWDRVTEQIVDFYHEVRDQGARAAAERKLSASLRRSDALSVATPTARALISEFAA